MKFHGRKRRKFAGILRNFKNLQRIDAVEFPQNAVDPILPNCAIFFTLPFYTYLVNC